MFKKKKYNLDINTADQTLQNVFKSLDKKPNTIPFDKLVLRNAVNRTYIKTGLCVSLALLLLILLAPLSFINREFKVEYTGLKQTIVVTDHHLEGDTFVMNLSGIQIDYDDIYARLPDGTFVFPVSADAESGVVVFPYEGTELNIFVPDINGKMLHAILSR
ncbi:MAG: hypothetical protein K6E62_05965 [Lachnospiraceae bacterium]|nr:hypothetical protein [Lachnospiraceae bacterium]